MLLGVGREDGEAQAAYLADKVLNLRVFTDEAGRMNLSVLETGGDVMVVSQFTLLADCRKGRRPSFVPAAEPELAEALYEDFVRRISLSPLQVETGEFGELMTVSLENEGPVTLVIDT